MTLLHHNDGKGNDDSHKVWWILDLEGPPYLGIEGYGSTPEEAMGQFFEELEQHYQMIGRMLADPARRLSACDFKGKAL